MRTCELFIAAIVKLMALLPRTPPTLLAQGEWTAGKQTPSIIVIVTLFTEFIISPVKKEKKKGKKKGGSESTGCEDDLRQ